MIWQAEGSVVQVCSGPDCSETPIWKIPDGGGTASMKSGMRARIKEEEILVTKPGASCVPFTNTLLVEMKFVPVMYTS